VDGRVDEDRGAVRRRRLVGVAGRRAEQHGLADSPGLDRLAQPAEGGVEAALEADLEDDAGTLAGFDRPVAAGQVRRERLLAEDVRAGGRRGLDHLRVRVGRRADDDAVEPLELVGDAGADLLGELGRRLRSRIRDPLDGEAAARGVRGVQAPDPPRTDNADAVRD
jgi:hypothetical protein